MIHNCVKDSGTVEENLCNANFLISQSLNFYPLIHLSNTVCDRTIWQNMQLTSTSHNALLLVAEVADWRPVVRKNTYCFFLCSSQVRNFSCSAWNSRTTSPLATTKKKLAPSHSKNCLDDSSTTTPRTQIIFHAFTPLRMISLLSLHFINKTIFQLVLQFTEFTWEERRRNRVLK